MKKKLMLIIAICLVPCFAFSNGLEVGEPLPSFTIEKAAKAGKLVLDGENITYASLDSNELTGKVRSILYMAARSKASKLNKAYSNKLTEIKFDSNLHQTVVVFNMNDSSFLESGGFRNYAKKTQKQYTKTMYVLDGKGAGKEALTLNEGSYAVILVDKDGKVLAFKDGALSDEEVEEYMEIIKSKI